MSPLLRGVEIGLAHGFLLVGPFIKYGPLRNVEVRRRSGAGGVPGLAISASQQQQQQQWVSYPWGGWNVAACAALAT